MIRIRGLNKTFHLAGNHKVVARNLDFEFPRGSSVALLGRNGAGKSSLLKMIAGIMLPDSGTIESDQSISWPVGFAGSFHGDLSGAQNTRFVARIYGVGSDQLISFVKDFAELGDHFHLPFRTYSSGMRARLAFGVSMGIRFGTYLFDEITAVGDARFQAKCNALLKERLKSSDAVVVSHSMPTIRRLCTSGAVLEDGCLTYYDDIEAAISHHHANMGVADQG